MSTLQLSQHLLNTGYHYVLTAKLSQDPLEVCTGFFIVWQCCVEFALKIMPCVVSATVVGNAPTDVANTLGVVNMKSAWLN